MDSHLLLPVYTGAQGGTLEESSLHDREAGCRDPLSGQGALSAQVQPSKHVGQQAVLRRGAPVFPGSLRVCRKLISDKC